jgi:hypothetical protein
LIVPYALQTRERKSDASSFWTVLIAVFFQRLAERPGLQA